MFFLIDVRNEQGARYDFLTDQGPWGKGHWALDCFSVPRNRVPFRGAFFFFLRLALECLLGRHFVEPKPEPCLSKAGSNKLWERENHHILPSKTMESLQIKCLLRKKKKKVVQYRVLNLFKNEVEPHEYWSWYRSVQSIGRFLIDMPKLRKMRPERKRKKGPS